MDDGFSIGQARVTGSTEKALRVACERGEIWIPKSVIHDDSEVYDALNNAQGRLVVAEWFAEKEGWVEE